MMSTVSVESVVVGLSGARVGASGLGRVRVRVRVWVWVMVKEEVVEVVLIIVGGCRETFVGPETVEPVGTGLAGWDRAEHYCCCCCNCKSDTWREVSGGNWRGCV